MQLLEWVSEPTTFVALCSAHRAIHLRHSGWRTWQKLAGIYCHVTELLALCYRLCWLVGPSDIADSHLVYLYVIIIDIDKVIM